MSGYRIVRTSWQSSAPDLSGIRQAVFIVEQAVPATLEWDGLDDEALHLLAWSEAGHPIGCTRILDQGHIGRMAVLPDWRRHGVGSALLQAAIDYCVEQGWPAAKLSAQVHAIGFYEQAGFTICSGIYLDAGIPHQDMRRILSI